MQYQAYTAKITNLATNENIEDWVQECNITLPNSTLISTLEARFQLDEKKANKDDTIKIEILNSTGTVLYTLQGKVSIPKRTKSYTGNEVWEYSIKDSYDKVFEKVVPENMTFYDLYLCNTGDKRNSLLHKIAGALGFQDEDMDFVNCIYDNGEFIRVPFVHLEENARWIDKLQAFKEASDGILYAKNGKLFFRPRNLAINKSFKFDRSNIATSIEESEKDVLQNGIKVVYDRFEKLENQVVFNLAKKIITEPNTTGNDTPTMRISYITSAVSNPTLTKATGYYFKSEDPNSKVVVELKKGVHYKVESWKETMAEIKFLNPFPHKLYVDSFEIKGVPLSMYEDNEVNVMFKSVEKKYQENFIAKSKNKFVQTSKQSEFLGKKAMIRDIINKKEYRFKTPFLHQIEVAGIYRLHLEDVNTTLELKSININLKPSVFSMDIQASSVHEKLGEVKVTTKTSATPKGNYVDLKPLEDKLEKTDGKLTTLEQDVRSKLHRMEKQPTEDVKENDVWLNPKTNEWKKFYNGVWNPISEAEILPAMKLYNSIETNVIKLQGTADKVGAYLLNDGEKFGSLNGEIAHVTFDKLGQFEAENPNNRVALNIKDPANPTRVDSQILLGVTNAKDPKWKDTTFAIGDEASTNRIEFKNGKVTQTINGKDLGETLKEEAEKSYYLGLMATGKLIYTDPEFREGANSVNNYDNVGSGLIRFSVWSPAMGNVHYPPNTTGKVLMIRKEKGETSPGSGGFYFGTQTRKEAVFITKIIAKIPLNYSIKFATNGFGNGGKHIDWLTDTRGTGKYETYIYAIKCGVDGKFGTTNFYYLAENNGNDSLAVEWYVSYATVFDCTANDTRIDVLQGEFKNLEKQLTFEIGGEANKYYPVFFTATRKICRFIVFRDFDEKAPTTWNTATHKGALQLEMTTTFGSNWDGNSNAIVVHKFTESYSTIASKIYIPHRKGVLLWLRGGGAVYHAYSSDIEVNRTLAAEVLLQGYDNPPYDPNYSEKETGKAGTYQETGEARTIKELSPKEGAKRAYDYANTVDGALKQGEFTITGKTVFDGSARFVSRGTNEVITIANGAIDFNRDGKRLTRIKNIRYGTISTDSKGKGVVNFEDFKQPMVVHTSIKSANFGKNMAQVFCYAEHISATQYRFYVGGTNEYWVEASPVKVVGTEWKAANAMEATLLNVQITPGIFSSGWRVGSYKRIEKNPYFTVEIYRQENENTSVLLVTKKIELSMNIRSKHSGNVLAGGTSHHEYSIENRKYDLDFNLLKKFTQRTNVKFYIKISLEPKIVIGGGFSFGGSHGKINKTIPNTVLTQAAKTITASASTSSLGGVTGTGEVSYIAMEID